MSPLRLGSRTLLAFLLCASLIGCQTLTGLVARSTISKAMLAPAESGRGRMEVREGLTVVHLYGSHQEMGTQYGTLLRTPLRAFHEYLHAFLPKDMIEKFLQYAREQEFNLPQTIREELQAIAQAADVPYMELVALNVVPRIRCSTLAVWGGKTSDGKPADLIMGRNADYFTPDLSDRGSLIVVFHPDEGHAVAAVTFLGMVGAFTGMNEQGVAFGNMLVFNASGPQHEDGGLTIQIALRMAAHEADSAKEMSDLLSKQRHVIPMNVMVADAEQALVIELGLNDVAVRAGKDGFLVSTNYFRTPELLTHRVACDRYDLLEATGQAASGAITVEEMKRALFKAQVKGLNLQAAVFEPRRRRMHVSINRVPASAGPYVVVDQKALFAKPAAISGSESVQRVSQTAAKMNMNR